MGLTTDQVCKKYGLHRIFGKQELAELLNDIRECAVEPRVEGSMEPVRVNLTGRVAGTEVEAEPAPAPEPVVETEAAPEPVPEASEATA